MMMGHAVEENFDGIRINNVVILHGDASEHTSMHACMHVGAGNFNFQVEVSVQCVCLLN